NADTVVPRTGRTRLGHRTSSAGFRLGPAPRRALGPAATPAAPTGRTRDRTRPMLQNVRKFLPGRRPHVTQSGLFQDFLTQCAPRHARPRLTGLSSGLTFLMV